MQFSPSHSQINLFHANLTIEVLVILLIQDTYHRLLLHSTREHADFHMSGEQRANHGSGVVSSTHNSNSEWVQVYVTGSMATSLLGEDADTDVHVVYNCEQGQRL